MESLTSCINVQSLRVLVTAEQVSSGVGEDARGDDDDDIYTRLGLLGEIRWNISCGLPHDISAKWMKSHSKPVRSPDTDTIIEYPIVKSELPKKWIWRCDFFIGMYMDYE